MITRSRPKGRLGSHRPEGPAYPSGFGLRFEFLLFVRQVLVLACACTRDVSLSLDRPTSQPNFVTFTEYSMATILRAYKFVFP
jgi:hypothetical protein